MTTTTTTHHPYGPGICDRQAERIANGLSDDDCVTAGCICQQIDAAFTWAASLPTLCPSCLEPMSADEEGWGRCHDCDTWD